MLTYPKMSSHKVIKGQKFIGKYLIPIVRSAGSDGSMSASGSAGLGFDPRWGSKFSFENFQPGG